MDLDDPVCLCFHVTQRKILRYIKIEKPRRASQLSQCEAAGTGCGWCRPYLRRLMQQYSSGTQPGCQELGDSDLEGISFQQYQAQRRAFRQKLADEPDDSGF